MEKSRSKVIVKSGYLFILTNFLLAVFNLAVGFLAGSLAITSDAAHSLIDAISGFVVVIGEKIAKQKKDKREKIERTTTVTIAVIIIVTGAHIAMEAIEKIAEGDSAPDYSIATIIILIGSIIAKFALAKYLYRRGEHYNSKVLFASGAETMNDMLISVAVFASVLFYFAWGIDIEAYVSIAISLIIFKIGLEFIFPKLSKHHHHPLETDPNHGTV
ncbi:cation diffusion facilitator family transporter [Candidatus Saccharibacteria bacterium]|nr:cation diffusion facilitator family transporter [Candidatus Saccharibacteria bacterium]